MLESLKQGLREAFAKISRVSHVDKKTLDEIIKDLQRTFISADVDVKLVFKLSERIRKRALEEKPKAGITLKDHVTKIVYEELVNFVGKKEGKIGYEKQKILLVGLFGVGKTSFAAKLAKFYKTKGLSVGLIGCDTHRPAAMEQLSQLANTINVPAFIQDDTPESILKKGLAIFEKKDVIIVDSAGRDSLDETLTKEIMKLKQILQPTEVLLVIPADIGQAAGIHAKKFKEIVDVTGVVITKLDATAKGGGAIVTCAATDSKIKFITTGEKPDNIEVYNPEKFISKLLGMPDLKTLLEKSKGMKEKAKEMIEGSFTLEEFVEQINGIKRFGTLSQVAEMIGFGSKIKKDMLDVQETKMKRWKHIIKSMTLEERKKPEIINASRITRISKGSGVSEADVRELLANYKKIKKLMKSTSIKSLKRGQFSQLFKQLGIKL